MHADQISGFTFPESLQKATLKVDFLIGFLYRYQSEDKTRFSQEKMLLLMGIYCANVHTHVDQHEGDRNPNHTKLYINSSALLFLSLFKYNLI